ncbi:MAG: ATP-binding protein [Bacteroidia bacterium]|nr:ATP-binding protein [Bacteroidia bacterium]
MDPVNNPYSPGAGTRPPELTGRENLRRTMQVAIARKRKGLNAKSILIVGLRGVGKTVLLDLIRDDAENSGVHTIRIEAPEKRSLPALIAPQLRKELLRLSLIENAKTNARRALKALAGFAKSLKVKYNDIEIGFDEEPEPGLANNGDLEHDLPELLEVVGQAAQKADTALVLLIDELQYVEEDQLAALITALHRCAQRNLPVTLVGAGLPQLRGQMGNAKSYAERLFEFPELGPLLKSEVFEALEKPAEELNVRFNRNALELIFNKTKGYPYFIQEWGKHSWDIATKSPITTLDVEHATNIAIADLDASFFRVRFDRLTPSEKVYLRAMAELGEGPHRSGDIADILSKNVNQLAPVRSKLIEKGMIYSPNHGETAFTVPLFDEFMRRIMPGSDWKEN